MTQHRLSGIPETMLIPLWARAVEGDQSDPIVVDEKAAEMVSQIEYDFDKFTKSKLSQLGVCIRTYLLDNAISSFLKRHDDAVVINLGAGLDTRYARLNPEKATWYDLDVPEGIELRKKFFQETEQYRFVPASMFDTDWMGAIEVGDRPVLFVAEGVLMYFEEEQVRSLFSSLVEKFPGAEMVFEMLAPFLVGKAKQHDSLKTIDNSPEFKWSLMDAQDMATYHPSIEFVEQWRLFDYFRKRAPLPMFICSLPFIQPRMAQRIVHLRFI